MFLRLSQRDERLGWTEMPRSFRAPRLSTWTSRALQKWLKDVAADQRVWKCPYVIPDVLSAKNSQPAARQAG
jgi:hypothetical protein